MIIKNHKKKKRKYQNNPAIVETKTHVRPLNKGNCREATVSTKIRLKRPYKKTSLGQLNYL